MTTLFAPIDPVSADDKLAMLFQASLSGGKVIPIG
jgi:hypothetical protein